MTASWKSLSPTSKLTYAEAIREDRRRARASAPPAWAALARPEQLQPSGAWICWYIQAGRGWGKTTDGRRVDHAAIPRERPCCHRGRHRRRWPRYLRRGRQRDQGALSGRRVEPDLRRADVSVGCKGKVYAAETPERLRGPNHGAAWCDEMAAWRYLKETWDMLQLTLRKGTGRTCVTTTPKPYQFLKTIKGRPTTVSPAGAPPTTWRTCPRCSSKPSWRRMSARRRAGKSSKPRTSTTWTGRCGPARCWRPPASPASPSCAASWSRWTPRQRPLGDACGIVVAGKGDDNHGYVLDDRTLQGSPAEWAHEAVATYHRHRADRLVAEVNQGGEMVALTIKTVDGAPPVSLVHASRGKITRAEPIAALFEQHRCHMVGNFAGLEDELCSYDGTRGHPEPARRDVLRARRAGICTYPAGPGIW